MGRRAIYSECYESVAHKWLPPHSTNHVSNPPAMLMTQKQRNPAARNLYVQYGGLAEPMVRIKPCNAQNPNATSAMVAKMSAMNTALTSAVVDTILCGWRVFFVGGDVA